VSDGYLPPDFGDPADTDALLQAVYTLVATRAPGPWVPVPGDLDTAVLGVMTEVAAYVRGLALARLDDAFAGFGGLVQVPRLSAVAATVTTTWTFEGAAGHLVPAGTQVSWDGAVSPDAGAFALPADLIVPVGPTTATAVVVAQLAGADGNAVPVGPLTLQAQQLPDVVGVAAASPGSGGSDGEALPAYLGRLANTLRTFNLSPINEADFARLAADVPGVARALARRGVTATNETYGATPGAIGIYALTSAGTPVSGAATALLAAALGNPVVGYTIAFPVPVYTPLTVAATVVPAVGLDPLAVKAAVTQALRAFLDPPRWAGGNSTPSTWTGAGTLIVPDLTVVAGNVPGVVHVTSMTVNGAADVVTLGSTAHPVGLPAGFAANPAWTTPSTVTVTMAAAA
jgi:uncharacterized phage protein gp47/JayE